MNPEMLLAFLLENGIIEETQMTELRDEQSRTGKPIEEVIGNSGVIPLSEMYSLIAHALGTEVVEVSTMEFPADLLSLVPPQTARVQGVLPLDFDGQVLRVAVANPLDPNVIDNLRFATRKDIAINVAPAAQIQAVIERYYGSEDDDAKALLDQLKGDARLADG